MTELDGKSEDLVQDNIAALTRLFPEVACDGKVDFNKLRNLLGDAIDNASDRYNFTWHGKDAALRLSQTPSMGTLRPCKAASKDWDTTQNLYIEGDNLEVLKLLQKSYHGRVKMIYIDPPYNTGNDFVYHDDFRDNLANYQRLTGQADAAGKVYTTNSETSGRYHTDWLNMIYPRLRLARNLLTDDGVIFISIDEHEFSNMKKVCDEVFGESNSAGEIIWKNSSKNDQAYISIQHEYIFAYVKSKDKNPGEWTEEKGGVEEIFAAFDEFHKKYGDDWKAIHKAALDWYKQFPPSNPIYDSKHYNWMDERGVYFPSDLSGPNAGQYVYDLLHPITKKPVKMPASGWRFPETTLTQMVKDGLIHFGDDESVIPNNKTYLKETLTQSMTSIKYRDGRVASKRLRALFGKDVFNNPKDCDLLEGIFEAVGVSDDDIVMDFFSGSGTTAEAVMQMNANQNRHAKYISVQIPENLEESLVSATGGAKKKIQSAIGFLKGIHQLPLITELGKERIRRAGEQYKDKGVDIGFRVFQLDTSNLKKWQPPKNDEELEQTLVESVSNILPGRTEEDLLYEIVLKMGFDLAWPIETRTVADTQVFVVADGALFICLADRITPAVAEGMAQLHRELAPEVWKVVCRDTGFRDDAAKVNVREILKAEGLDDAAFVTV